MFTGNYERNLDEKNRLIVPAPYRTDLGEKFYLSPGFDRECLIIYPLPEWEELVKKLKSLPKSDEDAQEYLRRFFSNSAECEMDKQGRMAIPVHLVRYADLGPEIIVAGVMDRIEIWDINSWPGIKDGEDFRKLAKKVLRSYLI